MVCAAPQRLAQHVARRRAEQQKASRTTLRIDLRAQRGEQTRHELHFIEHDQALALGGEEQIRVRQHAMIALSIEVEQQRAWLRRGNGGRQRGFGFAHLARPEPHGGGIRTEARADVGLDQAIDHCCNLSGQRPNCNDVFGCHAGSNQLGTTPSAADADAHQKALTCLAATTLARSTLLAKQCRRSGAMGR